MENNKLFVSIIIPALNEEKNIGLVIENILHTFKEFEIKGEIIVINNGSSDDTVEVVRRKIKQYTYGIIKLFSFDKPIGIGGSFWVGVDKSEGNVVCMLPGDNENSPISILKYLNLLDEVDIVVPFVTNKSMRSKFRNVVSFIYRFIINSTFLLSLNYTNGTVMYKKSILYTLKNQNKGFFYQTDILIRLIKKGYLYAEVPCRLGVRNSGKSKAVSFKALWGVIKGYIKLVFDVYFKGRRLQ